MGQPAIPKRILKKEQKTKKFQEPSLEGLFAKAGNFGLDEVSDIESGESEDEGEKITKSIERKGIKKDKEPKQSNRLPIKLKDGTIVKPELDEDEEEEEEEEEEESEEEEELPVNEPLKAKSNRIDRLELLEPTDPNFLIQAQEEIAKLSLKLISNPEEKYYLLNDLKKLFKNKNESVKKLSYLSNLAIFIDIIPSYRIRQVSETEKNVKVSKSVKNQREFEQGLLSYYQAYLSSLQNEFQQTTSEDLSSTIIHCFSILLEKLGHFNFFEYIIEFNCRRLMSKKIDNNYKKVYNSCKLLFEEDKLGENSLLMTKTLLRLMKNKDYSIPPQTIELLNYLNLNLSVSDKVGELTTNQNPKHHAKNGKKNKRVIAELSQHVSKKQKKRQKVDKELAEELREAEAEYTREEVSKFQSETLKQVFIIYFRILKTDPPSSLIPTVLDGLINFAHLINIDLFPDLFPYLKSLLYKQIPSAKPSLHLELDYLNNRLKCIHCCFRLLNDEIVGLNLDLKPFYDELYKILLLMTTFGHGGYDEQTDEISNKLILCLNSAFIEGVKTSNLRSMAFLKRLITISFQLEEPILLQLLQFLKKLILKYPATLTMFQNNGEVLGDGKYLAEAEDPDLSNPIVTNVAEFILLQNHFSPKVRDYCRELAKLAKRIQN